MNILVSNDDGIRAKGLHVLTEALAAVPGNRVYAVSYTHLTLPTT